MKTAESVLAKARINNEPILVLRAQDECTIKAVWKYYLECTKNDCSVEHIEEIGKIYKDFEIWRRDNPDKIKLPD